MITRATTPTTFQNQPQGMMMMHMFPPAATPDTDNHHHSHHLVTSPPSVEASSAPNNSAAAASSSSSPQQSSSSLLFNLSVLKEKVSQVQSLVGVILSPDPQESTAASMALSSINSTVQEIIVTATSIMLTSQQLALLAFPPGTNYSFTNQLHPLKSHQSGYVLANNNINSVRGQGFFSASDSESLDWFGGGGGDSINCKLKDDIELDIDNNNNNNNNEEAYEIGGAISINSPPKNNNDYEIIELDAEDLLAKYTHYCHVCGKGFKRDANLRMHMRAHGDEYKTSAALSNPMKKHHSGGFMRDEECGNNNLMKPKKYSCPQEGCRWNSKHAKFQPLKSMICAKNHYKRSHCPKMYVCKRCSQKQFSVLSDLRTHEKHCGDLKWQCSCGTTFSRKDKLMGHVSLFLGHRPAATTAAATNVIGMPYCGKLERQTLQMQVDDEDCV